MAPPLGFEVATLGSKFSHLRTLDVAVAIARQRLTAEPAAAAGAVSEVAPTGTGP